MKISSELGTYRITWAYNSKNKNKRVYFRMKGFL